MITAHDREEQKTFVTNWIISDYDHFKIFYIFLLISRGFAELINRLEVERSGTLLIQTYPHKRIEDSMV